MDRVDSNTRSYIMSQIKGRDTKPEMTVRRYLHGLGLRFRLHDRSLPGQPDLVLKSRRVAVFVHGCFWHAHRNCPRAHLPSSRSEYWQLKFDRNVARDRKVARRLRGLGWHVFVIWECKMTNRSLAGLYRRICKVPKV